MQDYPIKDIFDKRTNDLVYSSEVLTYTKGRKVKFIGHVQEKTRESVSANGNRYLKFQLSDEVGFVNVMIFNESLDSSKEANGDKKPKEGDIVIIKGTKQEENMIFANMFAIQSSKVYTKLSDLKN